MERGVKGVEFLLRFLLFSIGPLILELVLIAIVLALAFDWTYLLVVAATIGLYVWFTFVVTEWRVKIRREMNDQDTDANQKAIDSLLNFETVKYFGAEAWEARRYDRSMAGYESAAVRTINSLAFLNAGQSVIITAGLVAVMVMAAVGVSRGALTVGDFVMVNAYMIQITMPLNFLGTVYREIRQALVDMAEMFGLLDQPTEVSDRPGAERLRVTGGAVEFDGVRFGYDPARPILKGVTIRAGAGETVAIVGPSGSGKSTLGRLLFRFYDVEGGEVRIDGQDVRDVTQDSLHAAIGVVPQDTVLFNDSIRYNIAYGRPGASEEEVEDAARAARIHDFVTSLPQGYDTPVGERGLKLSGGEKQRVGIARTLLKDPPDPAPGRGHERARLRDGAGHPGLSRGDGAGPHGADHRAPPLHRRRRRPHRGARGGHRARGGHPRHPPRAGRPLRLDVAPPDGRRGRRGGGGVGDGLRRGAPARGRRGRRRGQRGRRGAGRSSPSRPSSPWASIP